MQNASRHNLNASASQNLSTPFSVVSIKGKVWRIKHRGVETILQTSAGTDHHGRPLPVAPVQTIDVVVVGLASGVSKTFYTGQYTEGSAEKPDCMSANGVTPDVGVPHRQSTHCGPCPQNQWGSRTTAQGKRAKACQDARRLAIVPSGDEANDNFGGPMLFRIPAMSLGALDKYCRDLERMNVDISQVITRLGFQPSMAYPSITFEAVGYIQTPEAYAIVDEHVRSEMVNRIVNESGLEPASTVDQPVSALAQAARPTFMPMQSAKLPVEPVALAPAPAPAPSPAPSPFRQAAASQEPQQPTQPPAPAPAPAPKPPLPAAASAGPARARAPRAAPTNGAAAPAPVSAGPVVTGAPEDMASVIDNLLG
jgi:hypothetical protein